MACGRRPRRSRRLPGHRDRSEGARQSPGHECARAQAAAPHTLADFVAVQLRPRHAGRPRRRCRGTGSPWHTCGPSRVHVPRDGVGCNSNSDGTVVRRPRHLPRRLHLYRERAGSNIRADHSPAARGGAHVQDHPLRVRPTAAGRRAADTTGAPSQRGSPSYLSLRPN